MEEKYKEIIEIGLALIEEKLMVKFRLSTSDVEDIMREYHEEVGNFPIVVEGAEAPIRVYWRAMEGEELSYDDAYTIEKADDMKKELIEAGFMDVEVIVKGKYGVYKKKN